MFLIGSWKGGEVRGRWELTGKGERSSAELEEGTEDSVWTGGGMDDSSPSSSISSSTSPSWVSIAPTRSSHLGLYPLTVMDCYPWF